LKDGVSVEEQDSSSLGRCTHAIGESPSDSLEDGRLVVDHGKHPVPGPLEATDRSNLSRQNIRRLGALTHVQKRRFEEGPVLGSQTVERGQRDVSHRLRSSGVQPHRGSGLQLEPAYYLEHALVGHMCGSARGIKPQMLPVPRSDRRGTGHWHTASFQETVDVIFVGIDITHAQGCKEVGGMHEVVPVENMQNRMTHIEDRSVDIQDQKESIVREMPPEIGVVPGQSAHPVLFCPMAITHGRSVSPSRLRLRLAAPTNRLFSPGFSRVFNSR
jgi:hypothetical protein